MPHLTESGFFMHVLAYFTALWLGLSAFHSRQKVFYFLLFYSSFLEYMQVFLPFRNFNYWDICANVLGLMLATAVTILRRKMKIVNL